MRIWAWARLEERSCAAQPPVDPLKAALEAVYEAQAAINDRVAIRTVVDAALNS
jgi:hypothetical protein